MGDIKSVGIGIVGFFNAENTEEGAEGRRVFATKFQ